MKNKLFEFLCGIEEKYLGRILIISPTIPLELLRKSNYKIINTFNSRLYKGITFSHKNKTYTFMKVSLGPTSVGDFILSLMRKDYEMIYFIGSFGTLDDIQIGDISFIIKSYNGDSFSKLLNYNADKVIQENDFVSPDENVIKHILDVFPEIRKDIIFSSASLAVEFIKPELIDTLKKLDITGIEMETHTFYTVCRYKNIPGAAVCYTSDNIENLFNTSSEKVYKELVKAKKKILITITEIAFPASSTGSL